MQAKIWYQHKEFLGDFIKSHFDQEKYIADNNFCPTVGGSYTIMFEFFVEELDTNVLVPIHHAEFISKDGPEDDESLYNSKILEPVKIMRQKKDNEST